MPFYVNDWLSSPRVQAMTPLQELAYFRLISFCWASQDASLPDDDNVLASLSRMGEGWFDNGSQVVRKCFNQHPTKPGYLTNERVYELWSERQKWRDKSAEGGRKSGQSRRLRSAKGTSQMVRTKREPNANSSSSSSSSSSLEKTSSSRPLRFAESDMLTATWMFAELASQDPKMKHPNLDKWAETIRLMRERDGRTDQEIRDLFTWLQSDDFWPTVVLSPDSLRKSWDKITAKRRRGGGQVQKRFDIRKALGIDDDES